MSNVIFFQKANGFLQVDPNEAILGGRGKVARFVATYSPLMVSMIAPCTPDCSELLCLTYAMSGSYHNGDLVSFASNLAGFGNCYIRDGGKLEFQFFQGRRMNAFSHPLRLTHAIYERPYRFEELTELLQTTFSNFQIECTVDGMPIHLPTK